MASTENGIIFGNIGKITTCKYTWFVHKTHSYYMYKMKLALEGYLIV